MNLRSLFVFFVLIVVLISCSTEKKENNPLHGNWAFLDRFGNYNEAWFGDSLYATYNKFNKRSPNFRYEIKNDSLYSNLDKRKKGLNRIAKLTWLDDGRVILNTEFVRDTLQRINTNGVKLGNAHPTKDTTGYSEAFSKRYEEFLISKGIISREEMQEFKNSKRIPEDVKEKIKSNNP